VRRGGRRMKGCNYGRRSMRESTSPNGWSSPLRLQHQQMPADRCLPAYNIHELLERANLGQAHPLAPMARPRPRPARDRVAEGHLGELRFTSGEFEGRRSRCTLGRRAAHQCRAGDPFRWHASARPAQVARQRRRSNRLEAADSRSGADICRLRGSLDGDWTTP
jgi:hypothetical protein